MNVDLWAIHPSSCVDPVELIARAARVCHKSEDAGYDLDLVNKLIKWGHLSVLEHAYLAIALEKEQEGPAKSYFWDLARYGTEVSKRDIGVLYSTNWGAIVSMSGMLPNIRSLDISDLSVGERKLHGAATFFVSGISRACSHQLVRHRLGSYSQESMRYCNASLNEVVTPESVKEDELWHDAVSYAFSTYRALLDNGVPMEDARMILPIATKTSIVVTMRFKWFKHFFDLRISEHAQWEIYELAQRMRAILLEKHPEVFGNEAIQ